MAKRAPKTALVLEILHVIFFYFGRKPNFSIQRNFRTSLKIFLRAVFENEGVFVENHGFRLHFWSQISKMESVEVKLAAYILRWVRNRGGGSLGMVWNERGSFGVLRASAGYRFRLQVKRTPKMEPKWTPECQIHRKTFRQNRFRNSSNPWTKVSRCVVAGSNAALCSLHQFWRFGRF